MREANGAADGGPVIRCSWRGATEHVGIGKPVAVMWERIEFLGC